MCKQTRLDSYIFTLNLPAKYTKTHRCTGNEASAGRIRPAGCTLPTLNVSDVRTCLLKANEGDDCYCDLGLRSQLFLKMPIK